MDRSERRRYERLELQLDLSCRKPGWPLERLCRGQTINVSTGGVYFEASRDTFERGDILKVDLSIPPRCGLLEYGGRLSGFGRVLRKDAFSPGSAPGGGKTGVAVEFCRSPRLCR